MFHKIAVALTGYLLKHDLIEDTQVPFCCYKLEQLIGSGVFVVILLLISMAAKAYLEVFSFAIAASVFRRHMGGWHAPSPWLCQIMSTLFVLLAVFLIGPIIEAADSRAVIFLSAAALTLVTFLIDPVFPPQMHMTKAEIFANRKLKNTYLLLLLLVQLISYLFFDLRIAIYTALGLALTLITISLEKIKNKRKDAPHEESERSHEETHQPVR